MDDRFGDYSECNPSKVPPHVWKLVSQNAIASSCPHAIPPAIWCPLFIFFWTYRSSRIVEFWVYPFPPRRWLLEQESKGIISWLVQTLVILRYIKACHIMQHPEWKTEFADVCQPVSEGRGMMQQCQDTFVLSNLTQPSSMLCIRMCVSARPSKRCR